jgi:hypothetical protein
MAGLVPAIHVLWSKAKKDVDARVKPGHDEELNLSAARPFLMA